MHDPAPTPLVGETARGIRILVLDVDGVLTDGGIVLGATGTGERVEMKRFDVKDGLGIRLLQQGGVEVAIITGRESEAVRLRAAELGITECHQNAAGRKLQTMAAILERRAMSWSQVAFMGDDLPDLPVMRRAALAAAPSNAVAEVRAASHWVSRSPGGRGAVREFAETLLRARGDWAALIDRYHSPLEEAL